MTFGPRSSRSRSRRISRGRHRELIVRIEDELATYPHRERLWRQLMLALYRAERQPDALAAYRRARETLVDRFGLDPSPALQRLERAILVHDSSVEIQVRDPAALREARRIIEIVARATRALPAPDTARLALLPELAEALMDVGDWGAADEVLGEAIRTASRLGERRVEARARVIRVRFQLRAATNIPLHELARTTEQAIALFEAEGDDQGLADGWSILAGVR